MSSSPRSAPPSPQLAPDLLPWTTVAPTTSPHPTHWSGAQTVGVSSANAREWTCHGGEKGPSPSEDRPTPASSMLSPWTLVLKWWAPTSSYPIGEGETFGQKLVHFELASPAVFELVTILFGLRKDAPPIEINILAALCEVNHAGGVYVRHRFNNRRHRQPVRSAPATVYWCAWQLTPLAPALKRGTLT
eukprot:scaffold142135_cov31-Tisochrysis_lutea.AAC.2